MIECFKVFLYIMFSSAVHMFTSFYDHAARYERVILSAGRQTQECADGGGNCLLSMLMC